MHDRSLHAWEHEHVFLGESHDRNERRTWLVVALTATMMVAEIIAGTIFGSMALVADGWHMSTHAAALAISAFAYNFARRHAHDSRFSFGTGKFGELAAFSSALILALIALLIGYESVVRLVSPVAIRFEEAIVVAVIGLGVNLLSAWLLFDEHHHHGHGHGHGHGAARAGHVHDDHDHAHSGHAHAHHGHDHHDHTHADPLHGHHAASPTAMAGHAAHDTNLRAAYLHVLADALTSVLAIMALLAGWFFGWTSLDPLMGVVGALIIARWSVGLLRTAGAALLDMVPDQDLRAALRERLEIGGDRVSDLHVWRLGPGHTAVAASIVSTNPQSPSAYKERLAGIRGLSHVTVEVYPCTSEAGPHRC
jgi:cation diffusion facilitator family transporter